MSGSDERVQEALAAYLEHLELGGPEPDVSHLTPEELETLQNLIGLLDQTEGIALGRGREGARTEATASTEAGERVVAALRATLPATVRIAADPAATTMDIDGLDVVEGWVLGTFGGRVRVWLLATEGALAAGDAWLRNLDQVFRLFPDTAAVALVEPDQSALLVQPEDCAATIEVPSGSLVGRRYRRPVHPVDDAVSSFLRELIPDWEPVLDIGEHAGRPIAVPSIAHERAGQAIAAQAASGGRARKTNPKRKALTELGEPEADALAKLLLDIHDGRTGPEDVEAALRRLATDR